ncbi:hypothetical protein PI124_g10125 [Phytophthora idaei]|nr:hypothetical protein PI125_g13928 [Phytophthora idaei]KAG3245126.1 hypothetical protein PI124_g10125 [Phytophthora idaei]
MARTSFSLDDDKQLVQLARVYEDTGSRICWNDVAHSMRRIGHTPAALKQRLRSLMRTQGNRVSGFPANFFSPVHRPRNRTPPQLSCDSFMRFVLFHDSQDEHRAQLRTGEQPQHHGEDVWLRQ